MSVRLGIVGLLAIAILAAAPQSNGARDRGNDPDLKEIRDYRLSFDNIQRYVAATEAIAKDPAVAACFKDKPPGNTPTLDEGQKQLESCPPAVTDLKAKNFTPREFLVITAALISDMVSASLKKQGTIKEYPSSISPENAAFLEQNFDKIFAMLEPLNRDPDKDR